MLDYAASFYQLLTTYMPAESHVEASQAYLFLSQRLNTKLIDIFHYDLTHRGEFFPEMSKHMLNSQSSHQVDQVWSIPLIVSELSEDEQYFRKLYQDCQRRLSIINHYLCKNLY